MPSGRWGFLAALDYETWTVDAVVERLAAQGYGAVEWTLSHFDPSRMDAAALSKVVETTRAGGLEVSEMVVQLDLVREDRDDRSRRVDHTVAVARAAADCGVPLINVLTGPNRWEEGHLRVGTEVPEGRAWSFLLDAFEQVLDGCAEAGVVAALEPCWGGLAHDFHSTGVLLRRFGAHPAFGINLDPSHFALARNDVPWVVHELGPYIRHVHIKDVAGTPGRDGDQFIFPLIGEGLVPWAEFFEALDDVEYRGVMSVEFESYRYYRTVLRSDPAAASELSMVQLRALEALMPGGLLQ